MNLKFHGRFLILAFLLVYLVHFANADSPQTVNLGYATFQGILNSKTNVTSFLGLRYAHPPIGKLRFQAPQYPPTVSGVQLASTLGRGCPQGSQGLAPPNEFNMTRRETDEIEDCLIHLTYLHSVYVPGPLLPGAKMPVLVWIHGGGYVSKTITDIDGEDLIRDGDGGVVVVEIAYRLGLFGFLSSKEIKKHGVLNAGLLDQEFALKWVQKYISSFGGDPRRVTIWGESAGAGSVLQHMVAHRGDTQPPLFRMAMTSSTFLPSQYQYDDAIPEQLYSDVVGQVGCSNASDTFACLVSTDVSTLEAANLAICKSSFFGTFAFVPVVDGDFILERPTETISRGKLNGDLLLSVTNSYEGRIFVNDSFTSNTTLKEYISQLFPILEEEQVKAAAALYTGVPGLNSLFNQSVAVMGESVFICPTYTLLNGFHGPTFKGELAVPPANHGSDIGYYFPSNRKVCTLPHQRPHTENSPPVSRAPPIVNVQLSASFAGSFLGVVKSDNPNSNPLTDSITPNWMEYRDGNSEMLFNVTEAGTPMVRAFRTGDELLRRCEFWRSVAAYTNQ